MKILEKTSEEFAREGVENLLSGSYSIDRKKLHIALKMAYKLGANWARSYDSILKLKELTDEN